MDMGGRSESLTTVITEAASQLYTVHPAEPATLRVRAKLIRIALPPFPVKTKLMEHLVADEVVSLSPFLLCQMLLLALHESATLRRACGLQILRLLGLRGFDSTYSFLRNLALDLC